MADVNPPESEDKANEASSSSEVAVQALYSDLVDIANEKIKKVFTENIDSKKDVARLVSAIMMYVEGLLTSVLNILFRLNRGETEHIESLLRRLVMNVLKNLNEGETPSKL